MEETPNLALWAQQQALSLVVLTHAQQRESYPELDSLSSYHHLFTMIEEDYQKLVDHNKLPPPTPLSYLLLFSIHFNTVALIKQSETSQQDDKLGTRLLSLLENAPTPYRQDLVENCLALLEGHYHRRHRSPAAERYLTPEQVHAVLGHYSPEEVEGCVRIVIDHYLFILKALLPEQPYDDSVGEYLRRNCQGLALLTTT